MHPIIAVGIAGLSFSFFPLMNAIGTQYTGPVAFSLLNHFATIVISALILVIMFKSPRNIAAAISAFRGLPGNVKMIALLSGTAIYLGSVFFLFAMQLMSKAGATMIAEMWPAMAIFIAPILIRKNWQKIRAFDIWMLVVCLLGVVFITASEKGQSFAEFFDHPFFLEGKYEFEEYLGIILAVLAAYCWSFSNVSRAHFANSLPQDFRDEFLDGGVTVKEAIYTYIMTYLCVIPLVFMLLFIMEDNVTIGWNAVLPGIANGLFLTFTSSLYSYALLKSDTPNINVLWYFAPLLASVWLVVFGFATATDMIILGGALIIFANIALVLMTDRKKQPEIILDEAAENE